MSDTPGADTLELERELRDGLEGLPEGPWSASYGESGNGPDRRPYALLSRTEDDWPLGIEGEARCIEGSPLMEHIARCSPDNIFRLLDALASLRAEKEELRRERDEARQIVRDIYWMALRYADGRKSYAVGMCNEAVHKGYVGGWLEHEHPTDPAYARDGMAPEYSALGARASEAERRAEAAESLLAEAGKALELARSTFAMLVGSKDQITGTSLMAAYASCIEAASAARAVASRIASLTKEP